MNKFSMHRNFFAVALIIVNTSSVYAQSIVSPVSSASGWHLPRGATFDSMLYSTTPKSDSNSIVLVPPGLPSLRRVGFVEFQSFFTNVPYDAEILSASLNLSRLSFPAGTQIEVDRITQDRTVWLYSSTRSVPLTGSPISGPSVPPDPEFFSVGVKPFVEYWHYHRSPGENFGIGLKKKGTDSNNPEIRSSQSLIPPTLSVSFYAPPRVNSVLFGDGTEQRSMVKKIEVHFSAISEIAAL